MDIPGRLLLLGEGVEELFLRETGGGERDWEELRERNNVDKM